MSATANTNNKKRDSGEAIEGSVSGVSAKKVAIEGSVSGVSAKKVAIPGSNSTTSTVTGKASSDPIGVAIAGAVTSAEIASLDDDGLQELLERLKLEQNETELRRCTDHLTRGGRRFAALAFGAAATVIAAQKTKTAKDLVHHFQSWMQGKESRHSFKLGELINDTVIERLGTLEEVNSFICKLLENSVSPVSQNDKDKFPIGCAICCSGGGKSTLCGLLEQDWSSKILDAINKKVQTMNGGSTVQEAGSLSFAFATFNSTCNYDKAEKDRLSLQASLGIRLVASKSGLSHSDASDFLTNVEESKPYASLRLDTCLKELIPQKKDEAVLILIDEIMKLNDDAKVNDILLKLSNFQQQCLRRSEKLFVLVTSLTPRAPAELTRQTQRRVSPISLPPISPGEVVVQAKSFAQKVIKVRGKAAEDSHHHLVSQFCASGGLLKNMSAVVQYFNKESNDIGNTALGLVAGDYSWAPSILGHSMYGSKLSYDYKGGSGTKSLEDLIFDHRVAVVKTVLDSDNCQQVLVRIPTFILRSIADQSAVNPNLTLNAKEHLSVLMHALNESRSDGGYAKQFEVALMRSLCLRLSLSPHRSITLCDMLPDCEGQNKDEVLQKNVASGDCEWIEVEKLTKEEVKKDRNHGTMVFSKLINEGAVEGFWYLVIDKKKFYLFLQMKFWKTVNRRQIAKWEKSIHKRATEEFGLQDEEYAPLFFSTSPRFEVTSESSLAMPKQATERILEPFGICPMMLYAEERAAQKRKKKAEHLLKGASL